jgi:hypothetical protein
MHHKRSGPKSTRSGCLLCKPHKRQGYSEKKRYANKAARLRDLARVRSEIEL